MSDSSAGLRRKIQSAADLQSVVRTMKAMAAANLGQYERAGQSLADYYRTVELGLGAYFRQSEPSTASAPRKTAAGTQTISAIVFGSDQGLVGRFNEAIADFAIATLAALPGQPQVWAVGERVHALLTDSGLSPQGLFALPNSVRAVSALVSRIQIESESHRSRDEDARVYVFHQRPQPGALCEPVSQRLLPLDATWQTALAKIPWPTRSPPELLCAAPATLRALVREYLFISLFRACTESLASENVSRLAAMERADRNIDELLGVLNGTFHRLRQNGIDEELFDVVSGFEALAPSPSRASAAKTGR